MTELFPIFRDLKSGCHKIIHVEPDSEKKYFSVNSGNFGFKRFLFGLTNAAGHFQRTFDYILREHVKWATQSLYKTNMNLKKSMSFLGS